MARYVTVMTVLAFVTKITQIDEHSSDRKRSGSHCGSLSLLSLRHEGKSGVLRSVERLAILK
jgi:hypothetical protein